jgi:hypothetical protein
MCVAAAVTGAGLVGAAATSSAAGKAASASQNATDAQESLAEQGVNITQGNTATYRKQGQSALGGVLQLLGLGPNGQLGGGNNNAINNLVSNLPGYQFQLGQGEKAISNAAAGSTGISSASLTGLNNYAQGQAQSYYGQELQGLGSLVNLGENAAVGSGNSAAGLLGSVSPGISSSIQNAGQAQAAGQIGATNALTSGLVNGISYAQNPYTGGSNFLGNLNNLTGGALNNNNLPGGNNNYPDVAGGVVLNNLPGQ